MNSAAQSFAAEPSASTQLANAAAANAELRIDTLAQWLEPVAPTSSVLAVGERFLHETSAPWLSLPIVDDGVPVGSVSRYELMQRVYIKPFGRELYGRRAITSVMHPQPLLCEGDGPIGAFRRWARQFYARVEAQRGVEAG